MKLTKRILCLALVLALTFALCACSKDNSKAKGTVTPTDNTVTTAPSTQSTVDSWDGNLEGDSQFNDGMFGEW